MAVADDMPPDDPASTSLPYPDTANATNPWGTYTTTTSSRGRATLQEMVAMKLSTRQDMLYPAHGFGRGGIGTFLATGASRAGTAKLPHGSKATSGTITARTLSAGSATNTQRPWTTTGSGVFSQTHDVSDLGSTGGPRGGQQQQQQRRRLTQSRGSSTRASTACLTQGSTSGMSKAWETTVPHPHNFLVASRSARIHDVPAQNRWAAMSFYENDPSEIKRHLDITGQLDQLHANGKAEEHAADQNRRQAWAMAQRNTFRRQRQEVALRYQSLNLPLRPSHHYVLSDQQVALEDPAGGDQGEGPAEGGGEQAAGVPPPLTVSLPKPTFVKVFDRMNHEMRESPRMKEEVWRRGRESARHSREKAEVDAEVTSLDAFEEQLQALQRQRQRGQYAQPE